MQNSLVKGVSQGYRLRMNSQPTFKQLIDYIRFLREFEEETY
ncbi:unnamed protein product [Paramecium sonneborni]|uniref:Uncharacterized protein n=1 Tax=Paramecium sonneborni TaxID=65129 RepID=A0A8S1NRH7_9CILI|nr:unnamed protein product [Paramecium sonneborni]